jgi:hypothetical protein
VKITPIHHLYSSYNKINEYVYFTMPLAQVSHSLPYKYNNQRSRAMICTLTTGELTAAGGNQMNSGLCCAKKIYVYYISGKPIQSVNESKFLHSLQATINKIKVMVKLW